MSIERIVIAALSRDEDLITAPPERVVEVEVIAGIAWLTMRSGELGSGQDPNEYFIKVPAMSLKRALDVAIEDSRAADAAQPSKRSGQPWSGSGQPERFC